jgi:release factor glutamine methyltransferase
MKMNKIELPEAYQIGWVPFIHSKIWLDSRPLIPRTETEYWVNEVIQQIKKSGIKEPKVLDLCAGSGAIGVAVAQEIPDALVDLVELDSSHHDLIRANMRINGVDESRVRIFGGDLFENIRDRYDFILSNPPYINMSLGRVAESVLAHEPHLALDGGRGGLDIARRILTEAPKHLTLGGVLWLEHEPEQVAALSQNPLYEATFKDQYGQERFSSFRLPR